MEKWELHQTVGALLFFLVLGLCIFTFAAYIINLHEQTVRLCISSGQTWTNDSCIPMIK